MFKRFTPATHNNPEDDLNDSAPIKVIPKRKLTLKEIKALPVHKRTVDESLKFLWEDSRGYWKESNEWDRNLERDMKDLKKITDRWKARDK